MMGGTEIKKKTKEELLQDPEFLQYLMMSGMVPAQGGMEQIKAQFSEDELDAIYTDFDGRRSTIDKQRAQSTAMRDRVDSTRGGTEAGGIFVADSPFEALASGLAAYSDKRTQDKATKEEKALSDKNELARKSYAREMARILGGGTTGAPPAPGAPPNAGAPPTVGTMGGGTAQTSPASMGPPTSRAPMPNTAPVTPPPPPPAPPPQGRNPDVPTVPNMAPFNGPAPASAPPPQARAGGGQMGRSGPSPSMGGPSGGSGGRSGAAVRAAPRAQPSPQQMMGDRAMSPEKERELAMMMRMMG